MVTKVRNPTCSRLAKSSHRLCRLPPFGASELHPSILFGADFRARRMAAFCLNRVYLGDGGEAPLLLGAGSGRATALLWVKSASDPRLASTVGPCERLAHACSRSPCLGPAGRTFPDKRPQRESLQPAVGAATSLGGVGSEAMWLLPAGACTVRRWVGGGGGGDEPTELQPTLRPVGQRFACMWYWKIVRRIFVVRSFGGLAQRGLGMRTVYEKELVA